ncbi:MAG: phosphoglycerate mutase [Actinobacteria bacterium]|nr:MAG: phosphoglycerate mutase [Actinomycetota bacterium]
MTAGCTRKVPSKQLVLIRHAKSAYPVGVGDHERPLNKRGVRDGAAVGRWLAKSGLMNLKISVVVSSARRTQETWALINGEGIDVIARTEPWLYEASQQTILEVIRATPLEVEVLVIIAHNPGLEDVAVTIATNRESSSYLLLTEKYPTSGVTVFEVVEWSTLAADSALLTEFSVPRG